MKNRAFVLSKEQYKVFKLGNTVNLSNSQSISGAWKPVWENLKILRFSVNVFPLVAFQFIGSEDGVISF